jgi:hypothetical protein
VEFVLSVAHHAPWPFISASAASQPPGPSQPDGPSYFQPIGTKVGARKKISDQVVLAQLGLVLMPTASSNTSVQAAALRTRQPSRNEFYFFYISSSKKIKFAKIFVLLPKQKSYLISKKVEAGEG